MFYRLYHGDCLEVLPALPERSVDAIITDPPYGIGLAAWDEKLDIPAFTSQIRRIIKPDGFYAFFGQMPSMAEWHNAAINTGFHFCEHVVWVKRNQVPSVRLSRCHESIYIYAAGKRKQFYQREGRYEDVKLPGILVDVNTVEGIDRYIKDLWLKIQHHPGYSTQGETFKKNPAFARLTKRSDRSPEMVNYSNVWSFLPPTQAQRTNSGNTDHPTQKPLPMMERLVALLTPEGATILDPCMGSGTTGIAAIQANRSFIGIEKTDEWYHVAREKIEMALLTNET